MEQDTDQSKSQRFIEWAVAFMLGLIFMWTLTSSGILRARSVTTLTTVGCIIAALVCLFFAIKPNLIVRYNVLYLQECCELLGYNVTVVDTPRAHKIVEVANVVLFFSFLTLGVLLPLMFK